MTAVVTGAGSGIGAAVARELHRRGQQVAVTDVSPEAAQRLGEDLGTLSRQLDVTDREQVRQTIDVVTASLGPIDVWVSNAGISTMAPFLDIPHADWARVLDVNLTGVFVCGQEIAKHWVGQRRGGAIVNTASMAGKQGRVPYLAHYVASKFGVVGLTQAMAYELAPLGIRVNAVCPGYVATSMQEREVAWEAELRHLDPAEVSALYVKDTPLGRLETPEDVALAVAFLAGPEAAFITGEALAVNGGAYMD